MTNTYTKYYVDVRENVHIVGMGDLKRIALREIQKI